MFNTCYSLEIGFPVRQWKAHFRSPYSCASCNRNHRVSTSVNIHLFLFISSGYEFWFGIFTWTESYILYLCITITHSMVRKLQGLHNGLLWELFAFFFIPSVPSDLWMLQLEGCSRRQNLPFWCREVAFHCIQSKMWCNIHHIAASHFAAYCGFIMTCVKLLAESLLLISYS